MAPLPLTGSNARSVAMQLTQVAYGGCWKCLHVWQRCSASTPRLAASQNGFVHSFGTGMGRVTWPQSLRVVTSRSFPSSVASPTCLASTASRPFHERRIAHGAVRGALGQRGVRAECARDLALALARRPCGSATSQHGDSPALEFCVGNEQADRSGGNVDEDLVAVGH